MATKAKRHIHKYHRVALSFGQVWACALPECSHYMGNHLLGLVPGKASFCWECDAPIILDNENMKEDRPRCHNCKLGIKLDEDLFDLLKKKSVIVEQDPIQEALDKINKQKNEIEVIEPVNEEEQLRKKASNE